jgi:hypothetical protein
VPCSPKRWSAIRGLGTGSWDFFVDWEDGAAATVALPRAEAGREPQDRALRELIGEPSTAGADFRTLWAAHDVRIRLEGVKRLRHPELGLLERTSEERLKLLTSLAATRSRVT